MGVGAERGCVALGCSKVRDHRIVDLGRSRGLAQPPAGRLFEARPQLVAQLG